MKKFNISPLVWPGLVFVALLVFNAIVNPSFFHFVIKDGHVFGSIIDILVRGGPLILVALGMTFVIATGGVDLSVGTVAAMSASVAAFCFARGMDFPSAFFFAVLSGVLVGLFNSLLIVAVGAQPIIASLIAMVTGRGVAQLLISGQITPIQNLSYLMIGNGYLLGVPFIISLTVFFVFFLKFVTEKTSTALFIEALGSNANASIFIGLNAKLIKTSVYVGSGVMAAIAGIVVSSNIRAVDVNNLGLFLELDAILAVVIGGTKLTGGRFSLMGSVLGALIIQTVTTTINTQGIAIEAMLMVKAAVVIIICLLQSERVKILGQKITSRKRISLKESIKV